MTDPARIRSDIARRPDRPLGLPLADRPACPTLAIVSDDGVHQARLDKYFGWVDQWWVGLRDPFPLPEPGSSLAFDDEAAPPAARVSRFAANALLTAVDHLHAARVMASDSLGPYAPFTVCRTALSSACEGVWLLTAPGRVERVRRARLLHVEDEKGRQQSWSDVLNDESAVAAYPSERVSAEKEEVAGLLRWVDQQGRQLGKPRYSQTSCVRWVGALPSISDPDNPLFGLALMDQWRKLSAIAHDRAWVEARRQGVVWTARDANAGVMATAATLEEFTDAFCSAALVTNELVRHLDIRRKRYPL